MKKYLFGTLLIISVMIMAACGSDSASNSTSNEEKEETKESGKLLSSKKFEQMFSGPI